MDDIILPNKFLNYNKTIKSYHNLGGIHKKIKNYSEAIDFYHKER